MPAEAIELLLSRPGSINWAGWNPIYDFNGDGIPDLVSTPHEWSGRIDVIKLDGTVLWQYDHPCPNTRVEVIDFGDVDAAPGREAILNYACCPPGEPCRSAYAVVASSGVILKEFEPPWPDLRYVGDLDGDGLEELLIQWSDSLGTRWFEVWGQRPNVDVRGSLDQRIQGTLSAAPNPFVRRTTISFSIDSPGSPQVEVFDVSGRLVRRILTGPVSAGEHRIAWDGRDEDGRDLPAGTYFYRLRVDGQPTDWKRAVRLH